MKTKSIIKISKILYNFGKLFGKGSSLPGKVALKLNPNILNEIELPEDIIIVTGSNGKTSTVEMIANVLEKNGRKVAYNKEGSNQTEGIVTMILNNSDKNGKVNKDVLVLESDERYTRHTIKFIKPTYVIITNLYRDQLTRNGHPEHIYEIIKEAITDDVHLILNADDPLSAMYGYKRNNVTYFGINKNSLSKEINNSVYNDGIYCPVCKYKMVYDYYHYNHMGKYYCSNCGYDRNNPDFVVTDINNKTAEIEINSKYKIQMSFNSLYFAYNVLAAFAVTHLMNIKDEDIVEVLTNYIVKNDRVQKFKIAGHNTILLTSKHENSISYNQSLSYIINENNDCTVVIIIDAVSRKYFTSETSWIWDIDFEILKNDCVKKIVLAGKYVYDLVTRFEYTGIDKNKIIAKQDLDEMMKILKEKPIGDIYVVTCFSDRMKFINRR